MIKSCGLRQGFGWLAASGEKVATAAKGVEICSWGLSFVQRIPSAGDIERKRTDRVPMLVQGQAGVLVKHPDLFVNGH